jgi:hypothetical protein
MQSTISNSAAGKEWEQESVAEKIYFRLHLRGFLSFTLQNVLTLKQTV